MLVVFRLLHILLGVLLTLGGSMANAQTTYVFDGRAIATCTLSTNVYVCPSLPLKHYRDKVEIASGWQVVSDAAAVFGYEHGLKMSGSARLVSYRDIDIGGIHPSLVNISGGSFLSDQTFRMGAQSQNITLGHIKADHIFLGTGSTGSVTATIEALRSVTVAHGMTVTGNIKAADVSVLAQSGLVNGNITATGTVSLGSTTRVNGNVIADTLSTQAANAFVSGNATVRLAVLEWGARVAGKIYCTRGNGNGGCDCVVNNSGRPVNSSDGPSCPSMARSGAHHIRIEHPITGPTCSPAKVTLKACANAACSSYFTGGESVTLEPGGASFKIDDSGVNSNASVTQTTPGVSTIALSQVPVLPYACAGNGVTAANDCKINFINSSLIVSVPSHRSERGTTFTVSAVKAVGGDTSCVPAISGNQNVIFKCAYATPASGTRAVRINGMALNASGNALAACDGGGRAVPLTFDSQTGSASATLLYGDAGALTLSASISSPPLAGSDSFVVAPDSFVVTRPGTPPTTTRAGADVGITISARNKDNAVTPNFTGAAAQVRLTATRCSAAGVTNGTIGTGENIPNAISGFTAGILGSSAAPRTFTWDEVGSMDVTATLDDYLGYAAGSSGHSNAGAAPCATAPGAFTRFVPDHFDVDLPPAPPFHYSGQPFVISSITARNRSGATTRNYTRLAPAVAGNAPTEGNARAVTLSATAVPALPAERGLLTASAPATLFVEGVALNVPVTYTFTNKMTAPTTVRLRAVDADGASSAGFMEDSARIMSGRLRLFGVFGRAGARLLLPYQVEYWTGASWLINLQDSSVLPPNAIALTHAAPMNDVRVDAVNRGTGALAGQGTIELIPPARGAGTGVGVVGVAVNLGATTRDNACLATHPESVGAQMPWLRANNGNCATNHSSDPAARATFGVIAPEQRRVIHVREVFR